MLRRSFDIKDQLPTASNTARLYLIFLESGQPAELMSEKLDQTENEHTHFVEQNILDADNTIQIGID
jgi:hypothetical protein